MDDEKHFFLHCHINYNIRNSLMQEIENYYPDFNQLDLKYLVQRCRLYKTIYGVKKIGSTLVSYLYILLTCYINLNLIWILTVCCMSYVVVNLSLFVVICTARQGFLFLQWSNNYWNRPDSLVFIFVRIFNQTHSILRV